MADAAAAARGRVLVVDDQPSMAEMVAEGLSERGYDAVAESSSNAAAARLRDEPFDALVTDLRMPAVDGLGLLAISQKVAPGRPVIIMTAYSAVESAVESIRQGAYHYLTKPFKVDELALFLARALDEASLRRETVALKKTLKERFSFATLIGNSAPMRAVRELAERVADASAPVLVTGETGTGKGLLARALHAESKRAAQPFVTVNCAAVPENLLESELFGHVKGAFTGAVATRAGLFEEAHGGTIFLDEIGEMPLALQAKLLHVIERGVVRAVGANKERSVDVRVVAATHRDLHERVAAGAFREDLFYRLDVVTIEMPALRHRREDLPALIEHFLTLAKARHPQSPVVRFSKEALDRMLAHAWPGNVRELENATERLVLLLREPEVAAKDLPPAMRAAKDAPQEFTGPVVPMREMQRRYAAWAYEQLGAKKLLTAEKLGVDHKTLTKWLQSEGDE